MKNKFASTDVIAAVTGLKRCVGMRVNNIYDIDNKTYLIRLQRQEEKATILFESGIRLHLTTFDWPKNPAPSGFTGKLRKHLKNKRLENIDQLGVDRVVDLQFGTGEAAYHVIVELYDRGNVVLTDLAYMNLAVLRPRKEGDDVRFAVREIYPVERAKAKQHAGPQSLDELRSILENLKDGDNLKRSLNPHVEYGSALIDHVLLESGFPNNVCVSKGFSKTEDLDRLFVALRNADNLLAQLRHQESKGYIIQREEKRAGEASLFTFESFEPILWKQYQDKPHLERPGYHEAVDEFFSQVESQKIDMKAVQQERGALKKLDNIKKDHENRITSLQHQAKEDQVKGGRIEMNADVVDKAILAIRSELALQKSWQDIDEIVKIATSQGDPVAKLIKGLKLEVNQITMLLSDPYADEDEDDCKPLKVDIDIGMSAQANARRYYDQRRTAAKKEQKTVESSTKAFKSAEKKTKQILREVATTTTIQKARHVFWFEKFFWCVTSDGYLVIAGRDQQQNELVVKRHLKQGDIYFHADLHGASSVVVKNPSGKPLPPRTIQEAALMSICYSGAWDAKFITASWWVYWHQVSKTAPAGEYLTTGSFMIRGKKNFVPPAPLVMGFGVMFRLEESCIDRHRQDWKTQLDENPESEPKIVSQEIDQEMELSEESENEDPEKSEFPDTVVRLNEPEKLVVLPKSNDENEEDQITIVGELLRQQKNEYPLNKTGGAATSKKVTDQDQSKDGDSEQKGKTAPPSKRGQHGKLKKIKEKYKDQDEEERELRMQILQSSGVPKDKKKKGGKENKKDRKSKGDQLQKPQAPSKNAAPLLPSPGTIKEETEEMAKGESRTENIEPETAELGQPKSEPEKARDTVRAPKTEEIDEPDEEEEEKSKHESADVFKLTGQPLEGDELLFAIPVVAPYASLSNFKFKVKVIPGTSKRGKAAKAAVQLFSMDKNTTQREKDLLRSMKDQDVARNLPGKVKVLAQNYAKSKK